MSINATTAMGQASSTASNYFDQAVRDVERKYQNASDDAKCQAAATITLAASIDFLAAVVGGSVDDTPLQDALANVALFVRDK